MKDQMVRQKEISTLIKNFLLMGEDFFTISKKDVGTDFVQTYGFSENAPSGMVITESGYLMLVKSFKDDLAWTVQRKLVNTYFKVKDNTENLIMPKDYPSALRFLADEYEKR